MAARALGLEIHTAPFTANTTGSVSDPDRAFEEAEAAHRCGFRVGGGLHPNVVEPQNKGFSANEQELVDAAEILEQYRALVASGETWIEVNGRVIDRHEASPAVGYYLSDGNAHLQNPISSMPHDLQGEGDDLIRDVIGLERVRAQHLVRLVHERVGRPQECGDASNRGVNVVGWTQLRLGERWQAANRRDTDLSE